MIFKRSNSVIGLDLGHASLKAVVLEKNSESAELIVRNFAIQRREDPAHALEHQLRKLLRKLRPRTRECALAFWPQDSVLRFVERSRSDSSSPREWLQSPQSPLRDLDHHLLDFCDLGQSPEDPSKRRFLVCASPKQSLETIARTLEKAGLHPVLMQLTPMALSNAFHFSRDQQTLNDPFLVADIGARETHISGGHSDQVLLLRTLPWGTDQFLEELANKNIQLEEQQFTTSEPAALSRGLSAAAAPLAKELRLSADFLSRGGQSIETIHLSGYLGTLPEFSAALERESLIPCTLWNPFQKITAGEKALSGYRLLEEISRLPAAAGAALQYLA